MAPSNRKGVMTGAQKAAALLMSMGSDYAAEVIRHLKPREIQVLGSVMASMQNVHKPTMERVMDEFIEKVNNQTAVGSSSDEYIREMMVNALGEDRARTMIDRILPGSDSNGLEALKWMDACAVSEVIRKEHPQIIAIVLSSLEPEHAAEVVGLLPERTRADILMRVATLERIPPRALQELDQIIAQHFQGASSLSQSTIGGYQTAANILNAMDISLENPIMESIVEHDQQMAERIAELMFAFENLIEVDDRGIQALLREITSDTLITALKGADDTIKDKIFGNISRRAAAMLREDMEARGPVRLSEVEAAQKDILAAARRLAEEGGIVLDARGEEYL